jgi:hypothetical protein
MLRDTGTAEDHNCLFDSVFPLNNLRLHKLQLKPDRTEFIQE